MNKLDLKMSAGRQLRLAIIGGGAGSREFIIRFLDAGAADFPVEITVFEPRPVIGRGAAWSDEKTPVLANMRLETLGPSYPDYELIQTLLREIDHPEADKEYPSRPAMGAALDERWRRKVEQWPERWSPVRHIRTEAVDLEWDGRTATIVIRGGARHSPYDIVVLSLGNLWHKPRAGFEGNARFVNGWDVNALEAIKPQSDVFIIGAGLTAIDATLRLLDFGHDAKKRSIVWDSETGLLPFIRPRQIPIDPQYVTYQALTNMVRTSAAPLTLESLWYLFRLEMRAQAERQKKRFGPDSDFNRFVAMRERFADPRNGREMIEVGIRGADTDSLWYSVAKLFDEYIIPFAWNALAESERIRFLRDKRLNRDFDRFWAPIPVNNGRKIKEWLDNGTIQLLVPRIAYKSDPVTGKLPFDPVLEDPLGEVSRAELHERYKNGFDYIVEASGIPAGITREIDSELVSNMLRRKFLSPRVFQQDDPKFEVEKGARVDWYSGAVLDADGAPHGWLYSLTGSLTAGAHRFTNSYLSVSVSAQQTATEMFKSLTD